MTEQLLGLRVFLDIGSTHIAWGSGNMGNETNTARATRWGVFFYLDETRHWAPASPISSADYGEDLE